MSEPIDCLVIGGGPAGLTAAIYLARFHLSVRVIDAGDGRAVSIPRTLNHAGYPDGIAGADLVARMRAQAIRYGADVTSGRVTRLDRDGAGYIAECGSGAIAARSVLLATGVTNRRPRMASADHDAALARGLIRYCPICDGYEVTDRRVGVIGTDAHGIKEALFLRGYTRDITLIAPDGPHRLTADQREQAEAAGVATVDGPCDRITIEGDRIVVPTAAGRQAFDSVYPALGSDVHSALAEMAGAACTDEGCIRTDAEQRTDLSFLYAAGDVVIGLDQISNAMGAGGIAATAIRNDLAAQAPLRR